MAHDHRGHSHAPASFGKAFAIGIVLNAGYVVAEIIYGRLAHSVALVADAGHNLGDVLGLLFAWGASYLVTRPPSGKHTYGFRASSILATLVNAVVRHVEGEEGGHQRTEQEDVDEQQPAVVPGKARRRDRERVEDTGALDDARHDHHAEQEEQDIGRLPEDLRDVSERDEA